MEFTVKRSQWLRGGKNGDGQSCQSLLVHPVSGHMCCLGFLGVACGADKADMDSVGTPADIPEISWPQGFISGRHNTAICDDIIVTNDSTTVTDSDREAALITLFAACGVAVKFVD